MVSPVAAPVAVEVASGESPAHAGPPGQLASPWGIFAGLSAAALTIAISPLVASKTFTPKYAVLLIGAAVGVVPFAQSLRRSRSSLASWGALGFLVVGLVSALTSAAPNMGIFGLYDWGTGWLMWLGCAGAYGIGLRLRSSDIDWVLGGLVVGAVANALLALYQTIAVPTSGTFGPYQANQADGFLGNPIHLEALLLGTIAVVAVRSAGDRRSLMRWAPAILLMSVALEFTTERLAILILPVLMIVLVVYRRIPGLMASILIAAGYAIGYLGGGSSLGGRVSQGASSPGIGLRLDIWKLAAQAFLHHPIVGVGPGMFEAGVTPLLTQKIALALGPTQLFSDAHNFVIEVAVTTGALGLICFAIWVLGSLARARNPLFLFALAGLAVESVEPLNIAITPLVFLALGASTVSWRRGQTENEATVPRLRPPLRVAVSVLTAAALALGTTMVVGDIAFNKAPPRGYVLGAAREANRLMPYWP
ncbi:MAG: O-antigen ligase family protein, partial [Acidimicrobiales bacterium]